MEILLLEANNQPYIVHLTKTGENQFTGDIYQGLSYLSLAQDGAGWSYVSKLDGNPVDEPNDEARIVFGFSFSWKGAWDGRLYFMDDEYWSHELIALSILWTQLEYELKRRLKPDTTQLNLS